MTIDISQFFDAVSDETWLNSALKSLKLVEKSELEKKLNFKTCEGVVLKSSYQEAGKNLNLTTFPGERKLVRFSDKFEKHDLNAGVDFFVSKAKNKEPHVKNLVSDFTPLDSDSYLDLYQTYINCGKEESKLKKYIEENQNNNFKTYISSTLIHNSGGSIVQELSFILSLLKFNQDILKNQTDIIVEVANDSLIFNGIAKLRALRFILESLHEQCGLNKFEILSRNSKREQTLYDPWMNMLRNTTSCASSFMGGADYIAMDSYDSIGSEYSEYLESALGKRQSRNTFHILNEESFLSYVSDPGLGSSVIEALTSEYIEMSFEHFRKFETSSVGSHGVLDSLTKFALEVELVSKERFRRVATTKATIAGINNFANTEETMKSIFSKEINLKITSDNLFPLRRVSSEFEELRHLLEDKKLKISVLVYGPKEKLSARLMFCTNYFEVLGFKCDVIYADSKDEFVIPVSDAVVFCSIDELYPEFISKFDFKTKSKLFIAGNKFKQEGLQNIYMGQNVLDVLGSSFLKGAK